MRLSSHYSWVRVATLTDPLVEKFLQQYPAVKPNGQPLTAEDIRMIEYGFGDAIPGKEGLATQWALQSIYRGDGVFPWNLEEFAKYATWYFTNVKEPLFKQVIQTYNMVHNKRLNSKNILDFKLSDFREIYPWWDKQNEIAKISRIPIPLPAGAELFYDDGVHQVLEVTSVDAACRTGQNTEWCTEAEDYAEDYLKKGSLYVFYEDRERTAQFYLGDGEPKYIEFKNVKNRTRTPSDDEKNVMIESGLMDQIIDTCGLYGGDQGETLDQFVGRTADPRLRKLCSQYGTTAWYYADNIIGGRFPEGEDAISDDGWAAWHYADALQWRFPAAERAIVMEGYGGDYAAMLCENDKPAYWDFIAKYPKFEQDDCYDEEDEDDYNPDPEEEEEEWP